VKPTYTDNRPRKFTQSVANAQNALSGKALASRVDQAEQAAVNPQPKPKPKAKAPAKPVKQSDTMKKAAAQAAAERRAATARDNAEIARRRAAKGQK
jgi:hypothetical protein